MNKKLLLDNLRCIPDWPIKGVNFRDVTTLFKSPEALQEITDEMVDLYKGKGCNQDCGYRESWLRHVFCRCHPFGCWYRTLPQAR